ncbi:hypothetical protein [Streptomyces erythrochromogenes]|uniref:hypothetical protein n=1 Tax=Streptomyces erythrochromogenes TaxID=285574 RepID=UPI003698EB3E
MSLWHANDDALALDAAEAEWAPWVRYTRTPPPATWTDTESASAYTPQERTLNSAVHEAAHAVLYMAEGYRIGGITLHAPDDDGHTGQAEVEYLPASGPWLGHVLAFAAGERAEVRWLWGTGRWTMARAWAAERLAWRDRSQVAHTLKTCHDRELTFNGDHQDWADYAWIMDRTDEALDPLWERILTLADHVAEHRHLSGQKAARIAGFGV